MSLVDRFPVLTTDRLILDEITVSDIPKIIEYAGSIKVAEMTLNIPHPYAEKDAVFWINSANQGFKKKTQYTFAIRLSDSKEFIGGIGLKIHARFNRGELGYWIAEPFWSKGYTTEAARAILKFGFEKLALHKILATHLVENPASGKVMINNGMIKEGELKDHVKKGESYKSVVQYRLTLKEFKDKVE